MTKIQYVVCVHFDSASEMMYRVDRKRRKATVQQPEWWVERSEVFTRYVVPSLNMQTFQDFEVMGFFDERDIPRFWDMRSGFSTDQRCCTTFAGPRALRENYYNNCEWLCVILLDSDDLYSPTAFELIAELEPEEGLLAFFEEGWNYSLVDHRLFEFDARKKGPGPWLAKFYPNSALASEEAWWRYRFQYNLNRLHHQIREVPGRKLLPPGHFIGLIHEANTERAWDNPPTEKKLGAEVTDAEIKSSILTRFGINE